MLRQMLKQNLSLIAFFAINIVSAKTLCIPVHGTIDYTRESIVRRALKQAQRSHYEAVLLDINTPGGYCNNMVNIMDMLHNTPLKTVAYVNPEAISAGSFIANVCNQIYFSPNGIMGAAAVINGDGKNLKDNLQAKIDSYLWAKLRTFCEKFPHRYLYQRAMMDKTFVLKSGRTILKPTGELLTLTAKEAIKATPQLPALADGIFDSLNDLSTTIDPHHPLESFSLSGFERLAQVVNPFIPMLASLGVFFLMLEFKTPGLGIMGLAGVGCIALSIGFRHLAGLGGTEAFILLGFGVTLLFTDLFIFGTFIISFLGFIFIITGLWWSGIDIWPNLEITLADVLKPLPPLIYAFLCWLLLFFIGWKLGFLKFGLNCLTLKKSIAKPSQKFSHLIGQTAMTTTPLMPSGKIIYQGEIMEACSLSGSIPTNKPVKIVSYKDFTLMVEETPSA